MVTGSVWLCRESRQQASKCGFMAAHRLSAGPICGICHCMHSRLCQVQFLSATFEHRWSLCLFLLAQTQFSGCHLLKKKKNYLLMVIVEFYFIYHHQTTICSETEYSPHRMYNILRWGPAWPGTSKCNSIIHMIQRLSDFFIKLQHFPLVLLPRIEHFPGYASFNWYLSNAPIISRVYVLISNAFHELQLLIGWVE